MALFHSVGVEECPILLITKATPVAESSTLLLTLVEVQRRWRKPAPVFGRTSVGLGGKRFGSQQLMARTGWCLEDCRLSTIPGKTALGPFAEI
jgi:hypothetical protein